MVTTYNLITYTKPSMTSFFPEHGTLTKLSNWLLCHTSWQCIQVSLAQNEEAPADFTVSCEERDSSSWRWGKDVNICEPTSSPRCDRRDPGDPRDRWQVLRRLFAEDGEAFRPGLEDFRDETLSQPLTNALAQGPQMETNAMAG